MGQQNPPQPAHPADDGPPANPDDRTCAVRIEGQSYELSATDVYSAARQLTDWGAIRKYYTILPDRDGRERRLPIRSLVMAALRARYPDRDFSRGLSTVTLNRIITTMGFPVYALS